MHVFLDFEASSLSDNSYPIEVGWIDEGGAAETHLIRPAPAWTDWDPAAEAIHGLSRARLEAEGEPHHEVARRMVETLSGRALHASSPSWDGKWLSVLLRGAGLPGHALRLTDSDDAHLEAARAILAGIVAADALDGIAAEVVAEAQAACAGRIVQHRALADARQERDIWLTVRRFAAARAAEGPR